jgi:competence protein ComGC
MNDAKQKMGFALVELLIIATVIIIGLALLFVVSNHHKKAKS